MGRVISASALGRLQEEHGQSTRSFWGTSRDFGIVKLISGSTTEAPWQRWFVSRDRTPFFLQTVVIKIALLDLCAFAVTGRTAHSSSYLRKGSTCCVDWLKLTGDRGRFNTHLRASLHKFNEIDSLKTRFRVQICRGRTQNKETPALLGWQQCCDSTKELL